MNSECRDMRLQDWQIRSLCCRSITRRKCTVQLISSTTTLWITTSHNPSRVNMILVIWTATTLVRLTTITISLRLITISLRLIWFGLEKDCIQPCTDNLSKLIAQRLHIQFRKRESWSEEMNWRIKIKARYQRWILKIFWMRKPINISRISKRRIKSL